VLLLAACGESADRGTLQGFEDAEIVVGGETWRVVVADDAGEHSRGLMGVTGLGNLDGMLFVYPSDTESSFWMKDTLIPLDIAFFDVDGGLVDLLHMEPCLQDPCPTYSAAGPYRYALETAAGGFDGVDELRLELPAGY
jgi:uncharacterized membrane protein (UPF0127 family)